MGSSFRGGGLSRLWDCRSGECPLQAWAEGSTKEELGKESGGSGDDPEGTRLMRSWVMRRRVLCGW